MPGAGVRDGCEGWVAGVGVSVTGEQTRRAGGGYDAEGEVGLGVRLVARDAFD